MNHILNNFWATGTVHIISFPYKFSVTTIKTYNVKFEDSCKKNLLTLSYVTLDWFNINIFHNLNRIIGDTV